MIQCSLHHSTVSLYGDWKWMKMNSACKTSLFLVDHSTNSTIVSNTCPYIFTLSSKSLCQYKKFVILGHWPLYDKKLPVAKNYISNWGLARYSFIYCIAYYKSIVNEYLRDDIAWYCRYPKLVFILIIKVTCQSDEQTVLTHSSSWETESLDPATIFCSNEPSGSSLNISRLILKLKSPA